jgi:large subunit ribosomal protein L6
MLERIIKVTDGISLSFSNNVLGAKGAKGEVKVNIHEYITLAQEGSVIKLSSADDRESKAMLGTTVSLVNNAMLGVLTGYEKKLELRGVGYRAQLQGSKLNLTLGYSHPVEYVVPSGIVLELPKQTEIIVKGVDKQLVGQVAAEIREFRKVEPYKGKGIRYTDEVVIRKDAKKK